MDVAVVLVDSAVLPLCSPPTSELLPRKKFWWSSHHTKSRTSVHMQQEAHDEQLEAEAEGHQEEGPVLIHALENAGIKADTIKRYGSQV